MAEPTPISSDATGAPPWWSLPPDFWRAFGVLLLCVGSIMLAWVGKALNGLEGPLPSGDFPEVQVRFDGQQAVLSGRVLDEAEFQSAAKQAAEGYRSWGMNPVASVRNEIVVRPNPPGFVVLIRERGRSMLAGETYTTAEQGHLLDDLEPALPPRPDTLLLPAATERGPSGNLLITIDSLKQFLKTLPAEEPLLLAATLGKPAQTFALNTEDTILETTFQKEGWDWEHSQALVRQLRKWLRNPWNWIDACDFPATPDAASRRKSSLPAWGSFHGTAAGSFANCGQTLLWRGSTAGRGGAHRRSSAGSRGGTTLTQLPLAAGPQSIRGARICRSWQRLER